MISKRELQEKIREKALAHIENRRVLITYHAHERVIKWDINPEDIKQVILHGYLYNVRESRRGPKYRFRGWDSQGEEAHVVFALKEEELIVITVTRPEEW